MSASFDDEFLTVAQIAERLKLNPQTLRNWIDRGQLPAVRIGRRVRIRRTDLERLLAEGQTARLTPEPAAQGLTAEDFWSGEAPGTPLNEGGAEINDDHTDGAPS
jgi:excisionase family DNA binding protein